MTRLLQEDLHVQICLCRSACATAAAAALDAAVLTSSMCCLPAICLTCPLLPSTAPPCVCASAAGAGALNRLLLLPNHGDHGAVDADVAAASSGVCPSVACRLLQLLPLPPQLLSRYMSSTVASLAHRGPAAVLLTPLYQLCDLANNRTLQGQPAAAAQWSASLLSAS